MHSDRCANNRRQKCRAKEVEEKLKYNSLCTEIQRMWNLQCKIIPVVTGATGTTRRGLRRIFEGTPGKHSIYSL